MSLSFQASSNWNLDFDADPRVCQCRLLAAGDVSTDCLLKAVVARQNQAFVPALGVWRKHDQTSMESVVESSVADVLVQMLPPLFNKRASIRLQHGCKNGMMRMEICTYIWSYGE